MQICHIFSEVNKRYKIPKGQIKHEQSRETGNIEHTRGRQTIQK